MIKKWTLLNKPIIAFYNLTYKEKLRACKRYSSVSIKQKLVKLLLYGLVITGLDRLVFESVSKPHPEVLDEDWTRILTRFDVPLIITFPSINRSRYYLYALRQGRVDLFIKCGYSGKDRRLMHEYENLKLLNEKRFQFKVPKALFFEDLIDCSLLGMEPLPLAGGYLFESERELREVLGSMSDEVVVKDFTSVTWYDSRRPMPAKYLKHPIKTCLVHGDVHSKNLIKVDESIYVIDWEGMVKDGPVLADEVVFYLNESAPKLGMEEAFKKRFLDFDAYDYEDVLMALYFLAKRGRHDAEILFNLWQKYEKYVIM